MPHIRMPFLGVGKPEYTNRAAYKRQIGRLVQHKRKPRRDPMTAIRMAEIRDHSYRCV